MSKTPIINMPSVSRQLTIEQEKSLQSGNGNIGIYLKGLQTKIIDDKISKKEKNMFSSTLFLLNWLNKNTNIDMLGLKEILNGAYTVIKDDNGMLYKEVCKLANNKKDKKRGTAPQFINGVFNGGTESSHYSCPSKQECKHPSGKDQIRMGQGDMYDCNKEGTCNLKKNNNFFDLLIGVQCNKYTKSKSKSKSQTKSQSNYKYKSKLNQNKKNTWFQFEYARISGKTFKEKLTNKYVHHLWSTFCYALSFCKKNQGTFGTSYYTENTQPYILKLNNKQQNNITSSNDVENKINNTPSDDSTFASIIEELNKDGGPLVLMGGKKRTKKRRKKLKRYKKNKTKKNNKQRRTKKRRR